MAAQLFQIAVYDRNGCFEMNVFQDGSEEHLRQSLAANGCYNVQIFSVQLDDISDENPLVVSQEDYYNKQTSLQTSDQHNTFIYKCLNLSFLLYLYHFSSLFP